MALALDSVNPLHCEVGYGQLGRCGNLGYDGQTVTVGGHVYRSALSTHPPARLVYDLAGRHTRLSCRVALNDDVPPGQSHAVFAVIADGRVTNTVQVRAGEPAVPLVADLRGVRLLELTVETSEWASCHAVWLEPQLESTEDAAPEPVAITDPLKRAEIRVPGGISHAERCIATLVSPGFERWGDDLLASIVAYGNCPDAQLVVVAIDGDSSCEALAAKYRARYVPCRSLSPLNRASKAVLYSVAKMVSADRYLCLDADTLVLDDVEPIFGALDALPARSILACREGNDRGLINLAHALELAFGGGRPPFFDPEGRLASYPLVVNDGLFAGQREALLALDAELRSLPGITGWVDERIDVDCRHRFAFNVAGARLDALVELDSTWNVQLHVQDVEPAGTTIHPGARWHGNPVRVVHFSGEGKHKAADLRQRCRAVEDPVVGPGGGDGYAAFIRVLRAWLGRRGLAGLTWSFYGTTDGQGARVRDPSIFPLLGMLHHVVRSNGCVRVLETGTARGVSAACLASAVAHRPGGRVVSFDPFRHPDAPELWAELPEAMRGCIEQRPIDSIAGMQAALAAGETYQAALLDSIHLEEHLWAELELAAQLVCEGGLILCHDPILAGGTVEGALRRLERAGYGVTRLWTATAGEAEDDHLGMAVIENRRRADGDTGPTVLDTTEPWVRAIVERTAPYTMTSPERVVALCAAVEYIVRSGIPGAFVECGVWRGGSAMAMALALQELGAADRQIVLFDTFGGMPEPDSVDRRFDGISAADLLAASDRGSHVWAYASLEDVRANMATVGYPDDLVRCVVGKVEDTVPAEAPVEIALLRLDTDWYGSTRHELEHLLPRLADRGVLLIDDYGHWQGARAAVDDALKDLGTAVLLHAVDYTGRIAVVPRPTSEGDGPVERT